MSNDSSIGAFFDALADHISGLALAGDLANKAITEIVSLFPSAAREVRANPAQVVQVTTRSGAVYQFSAGITASTGHKVYCRSRRSDGSERAPFEVTRVGCNDQFGLTILGPTKEVVTTSITALDVI